MVARRNFAKPADFCSCDSLSSYLRKRPSNFAYAGSVCEGDVSAEVGSHFLFRSTKPSEYLGNVLVRLQTVFKLTVPGLYPWLDVLEGKPVAHALLNSSLNDFNEPISCTPWNALKTF